VGQRGHGKSRGLKLFLWKRNKNHQMGKGHFVHHRIVSEVERVEFVSDRLSYI